MFRCRYAEGFCRVADMSCRNPPDHHRERRGGSIGFRSDKSVIAAPRAGRFQRRIIRLEMARGLTFWCGGRVSSFGLPLNLTSDTVCAIRSTAIEKITLRAPSEVGQAV